MQLPVEQFPILQPGQMNPYNQAFQSGLGTYQNIMQNAYYPLTQSADIASKQAYAQYLPNQIASSILSNPYALAFISSQPGGKDKINQLVQQASSPGGTSNAVLPGKGATPWQNFNNFLPDGLKQTVGGQYGNMTPTPGSNDNSGMRYDSQGNNITATPDQVNQIIDTNNQGAGASAPQPQTQDIPSSDLVNSSGAGLNMTDTMYAKAFPLSQPGIQLAAQQTAAQTTAKNNADMLAAQQKKASSEGDAANTLIKSADDFDKAYKSSRFARSPLAALPYSEYYPIPGRGAVGTAKTASQIAATQLAENLFGNDGGKLTNYKEKLAQQMKFSPGMAPETEQYAVQSTKAMAARVKEHQDFINYMQSKGVTDPNKIQARWIQYNWERPAWDSVNSQPIKENLNSYKDYLDDIAHGRPGDFHSAEYQSDALNAYKPGMKIKNEPMWMDAPKNAKEIDGQSAGPDSQWWVRPDGKAVPVHNSRRSEAALHNWRSLE